MSDLITRIIPRPRTVTLAGRDYAVWEARLCDLADIQAWLDSHFDDPLDDASVRRAVSDPGMDPADRDAVLFPALARAEEGPPTRDDDRGRALLATPAGLAAFVFVSLKRGTPGLTAGDVAEAVAGATAAELDRLNRVFFGVDAAGVIAREVFGPDDRGTRPAVTWGECFAELAGAFGWTYPQIAEMTLSEFRSARRGGKPDDPPGKVVSLDRIEEERAEMQRRQGLTPDVPSAGGDDDTAALAAAIDPSDWVHPKAAAQAGPDAD